jgi:putative endonuclease
MLESLGIFLRRLTFSVVLSRPLCTLWDRWIPLESLGPRGERIAERHLLRNGYYIVGRNQRSRHGEIDLIAVDHKTVVFVEVKTRASNAAGFAVEAVDEAKEERISKTAAEYVRHRHLDSASKRFDVIAIDFEGESYRLTHYQHAFESSIA